jgi:hypothetical protein
MLCISLRGSFNFLPHCWTKENGGARSRCCVYSRHLFTEKKF